jgi:hypothetical protein
VATWIAEAEQLRDQAVASRPARRKDDAVEPMTAEDIAALLAELGGIGAYGLVLGAFGAGMRTLLPQRRLSPHGWWSTEPAQLSVDDVGGGGVEGVVSLSFSRVLR